MIITGLPRSRTAWLSVFMSQSKTYFHHEAINGCRSIHEYQKKTKGCGDSTTGFLPLLLLGEIKNKKTVIIKKSKDELGRCIKWCENEYGAASKATLQDMHDRLCSIDGLIINQSDINNRLQDIWEYLVDDKWHGRYSELIKFNIQLNSTSIDEQAAKAFYDTIQFDF